MSEQFARAAFGSEALPVPIEQQIGQVANTIGQLAEDMAKAKDEDTARYDALKASLGEQTKVMDGLKAEKDQRDRDSESKAALDAAAEIRAFAATLREPSKASFVGGTVVPSMSGYAKGAFVYNLWRASDPSFLDAERQDAYRTLAAMTQRQGLSDDSKGSLGGPDQFSPDDQTRVGSGGGGWILPDRTIELVKATLGTAATTGGNIIANAVITDLVKPGRYRSAVTGLVDAIRGVSAYQTQIPVRASAPARAVVALWGDTKENVNLTYGAYTATMYTLARIYDVAKQFLRFSQGAAEQDILQELAHAFELGEAYYTLQGSGTNEPYGIQTALATQFGAFTSSFSPSATTLAGSIATALATAAGALAVRNRNPEAALLGPLAYWTMVAQGTDTAGFFFAEPNGVQGIRPGTLISPFGIPVYPESQLAGNDDLLIGEFSAQKVYFGESYRVDTSDQAGDRWDKNLVGFRGEEEMGLDARPAVNAGAFQFIADVLP